MLAGLRTLTPYLEFAGDVRFEYLQQGGADFTADQAMLDQAKPTATTSPARRAWRCTPTRRWTTSTPSRDRFLRGGACYTTVPAINVVAEKHYAWALAIAAGIATNRDGVPWGYLGSVNDVFKTPQADSDQTMAFAHPATGSGAFTYTSIHEASHYLGLAHPHDSIGATRNADGSARYYDGFTWAFNSTAAPSTYSHTELIYSILDQENIARGHAAYYLKWTDEALADGGQAYVDAGIDDARAAPARGRARLRQKAIDAEQGRGGEVREVRLRQGDVRRAACVARGGRLPRPRPRPRARHERAREGHAEGRRGRPAPPRRSRAASGDADRPGSDRVWPLTRRSA